MSPKYSKATEPEVEATPESSTENLTLEKAKELIAQLEADKAAKEKKIDELERKEEGWLVTVNNPQYDGSIYDVHFSNGQAWIPKDRVFKRTVRSMPSETEMYKEANEAFKIDHHTTIDDIRKTYEKIASISSAEYMVILLTNDHGYKAEYFTKDRIEELNRVRNERAKQRAEADMKLGTMKQQAERLEKEHMALRGA